MNEVNKLARAMTAAGMRPVIGTLKGCDAPVGTILGPKDITREYLVIVGHTPDGAQLGYATSSDLQGIGPDPRSVAEFKYWKRSQQLYGEYQAHLDRRVSDGRGTR